MIRLVSALMLLTALTGCRSTSNLSVVDGFDAERYMGVWYEAARYPHRFEKGLTDVTASYSIRDDGRIRVVNRGFDTARGEWRDIKGIAKFRGAADRGWLKVSFFGPFYASYKIIYLDADYTEAIVTGPTYGYCWILVRNPSLPQERLEALVRRATDFGFDPDRLILVNHGEVKP